eukprot:m.23456 g.23456  ORF g.23456 m.23456 type:complete len:398 (-) comp11385_c0_seq1:232-1425(-)
MSLYEGLGLGGDDEKEGKVDQGWDLGKSMIASQLKRKKLLNESKKLAAEVSLHQLHDEAGWIVVLQSQQSKPKPRLGFKPAALRHAGASKTSTTPKTTIVTQRLPAGAMQTLTHTTTKSNTDEPFFETSLSRKDIQNPYDPRRPNDFEEVRVFMERRKAEMAEMAELPEGDNEPKAQRAAIAPPPQLMASTQPMQVDPPLQVSTTRTLDDSAKRAVLGLSGDDAFAKRQAMSMSGDDAFARRQALSQAPSVANKLMQKMGWNEGKGLGKAAQGINTALSVDVTQPGMGRVVAGTTTLAPSPVLLLKNLVGPGEVDADLQPETAEECRKYGPVVNCLVFECPRGSVPDHEAVRTFVHFENVQSAQKAYQDMEGRFFGGRQVRAEFYSPAKFQKFDLAP